jgi:hypothetical protein
MPKGLGSPTGSDVKVASAHAAARVLLFASAENISLWAFIRSSAFAVWLVPNCWIAVKQTAQLLVGMRRHPSTALCTSAHVTVWYGGVDATHPPVQIESVMSTPTRDQRFILLSCHVAKPCGLPTPTRERCIILLFCRARAKAFGARTTATLPASIGSVCDGRLTSSVNRGQLVTSCQAL